MKRKFEARYKFLLVLVLEAQLFRMKGGLLSSSVHFAFEIAGCTHVDSPE